MVPSHVTAPLRIAAIGGPTASGKSALALALRQRGVPIEVVNFDALQVYRGVDAATAKPTAAERARLPMHLLDIADPDEAMTAGRWATLADAAIAAVTARGQLPLLVGGTGLYLRALVRGLAPIPAVPAAVRQDLAARAAQLGDDALHDELAQVDPVYAAQTPTANRQRVQRALEVWHATGRSFSDWHAAHRAMPDRYACGLVVLTPQRPWLAARIDARAAEMATALLDEVRTLLGSGVAADAAALQALGYRDAVAIIRGHGEAAQLPALLAAAHRAYAKRQQTWFGREPAMLRIDPSRADLVDCVAAQLAHFWGTSNGP